MKPEEKVDGRVQKLDGSLQREKGPFNQIVSEEEKFGGILERMSF